MATLRRADEDDEAIGQRRRSKIEMFAHLVWATKGHSPNMTPEMERTAHRCIISEAEAMRCEVLAIGGMPDHVHLVVRLTGDVGVSALAKKVKGASSYLLNTLREPYSDRFDWQKGFAAFSLDKTNLPNAIYYVQHQKQHHQANDLWPIWEETDEPAPPPLHCSSEGR